MKMEPELYWPEHRVYLFGVMAYFPNDIADKQLHTKKLRHYFDADNLLLELQQYAQDGYFTFTESGADTFAISNIDSSKFREALQAYLDMVKASLPAEHKEALLNTATKQYKQRGYLPIINWTDIYGDTTAYQYSPPFWEMILTLAMDGLIKLEEMCYSKTVPMSAELLPFYERPIAKIEIIDKMLQQRVAKPKVEPTYTATLQLSGKNLRLKLNGKSFVIWQYKSKTTNSYRIFSSLYENSEEPLTKDRLGLKPNSKTELKHLPNNIGFTGVLKKLFIDVIDIPPALLLHKSIKISEDNYEQLLEEAVNRQKHFLE